MRSVNPGRESTQYFQGHSLVSNFGSSLRGGQDSFEDLLLAHGGDLSRVRRFFIVALIDPLCGRLTKEDPVRRTTSRPTTV